MSFILTDADATLSSLRRERASSPISATGKLTKEQLALDQKMELIKSYMAEPSMVINFGPYYVTSAHRNTQSDFEIMYSVRPSDGVVRRESFISADHPLRDTHPWGVRRMEHLSGLPLVSGANVFVAASGAGKSAISVMLYKAWQKQFSGAVFIPFGEPRARVAALNLRMITSYRELAREFLHGLCTGSAIFVDSFKNPVYDTPGAAAEVGMSSTFRPLISDLSSVADAIGIPVFIVVNPTTTKTDAINSLIQGLKTSANLLMYAEENRGTYGLIYRENDDSRVEEAFTSTEYAFSYRGSSILQSEMPAISEVLPDPTPVVLETRQRDDDAERFSAMLDEITH